MDPSLDWPTRMRNVERTGYVGPGTRLPLKLAWRYQRGGYVWEGPTVVNGVVYIPGDGMTALEQQTGEVVWKAPLVKAQIGYTSATHWNNTLYVCGLEGLYTLDAETGAVKLKLEGGSINSSPCVYGRSVFWGMVGRGRRRIQAADAVSGELKWIFDTEGSIVHFTPAANAGILYCASVGNMYALDAETGTLLWRVRFEAGHPVDAASIYRERVIVSVRKLGLVALTASTGEVLWQFKTEHGPFTGPSVCEADGIAYFASGPLHAVSITDGSEIWTTSQYGLATSPPIVVGDHIFIGGGRHRFIRCFDRHTGEKAWEYPTEDLVYSAPAYANGRLVIGSHDGYVYCFEEA